jgi:hypothetical protein
MEKSIGEYTSGSKFYQITKGMLWNRQVPKLCRPTVYKVCSKQMPTYTAERFLQKGTRAR